MAIVTILAFVVLLLTGFAIGARRFVRQQRARAGWDECGPLEECVSTVGCEVELEGQHHSTSVLMLARTRFKRVDVLRARLTIFASCLLAAVSCQDSTRSVDARSVTIVRETGFIREIGD